MKALVIRTAIVAAGFLVTTSVGQATKPPTSFGFLFPDLPAYTGPTDEALAALTAAGTTTNPGPMFDLNLDQDDNPDQVPSVFTYYGQFIDHDMTLDLTSTPTSPVDPNGLDNSRDQRLNLDSVFGPAKKNTFPIYAADGNHLLVNGRDLPRNADGSAIIVEGRNDENQVIAQIHVAFLRAYNKLIDQGMAPSTARDLMAWRHQWIVVHDFLPELLDTNVYFNVFRADGSIVTQYYDPKKATKAEMPVEFSVAAYRFGHSIVRKAYVIAQGGPKIQVFNGTANDLHGGRPITPDHTIYWPNFVNVDGVPQTVSALGQSPTNVERKVDTLLSSGLFLLPIPGAAPSGSNILAFRNLQRGREYGLASGQAVAARLGVPVLSNAAIANAIPRLSALLDPAYQNQCPLWLYVLAESQIVEGGRKIGPVGSRIIAEVIGGLILADKNSYFRVGWTPPGGFFRVQDLLREAGVAPIS